MGWNVNILTDQIKAPLATFRPSGYVYAGQGTQHVMYEGFTTDGGSDGHVHELYWDGQWHHNDLTGETHAPLIGAGSLPLGYDFNQPGTIYGTQHVTYVGRDGHVHELWYGADNNDGWQHHDLTQATQAPAGVNVTSGYGYKDYQRVFYEGTDGHIIVLTWGQGGWNHYDLSAATGAPVATGPPSAYVFYDQGSEHAIYRGADGHIHELWDEGSGWHHNDLTLAAGAPLVSDEPAGCALRDSSLQHIGYRGVDGQIHELWWLNGTWRYRDLNSLVPPPHPAPAAPGPIAAYAFDWEQSLHFVFTDTDGYIHEWWFIGQDWHINDLTVLTECPLALSPPSGYVFVTQHTQHNVYVDHYHRVVELWWQR